MTTKFNVGDTVLIEGIVETIYIETVDNEPIYHVRIKGAGMCEAYGIRVKEDVMKSSTSISTGCATYTAEDIRTCDYCKHNAGLPSNNGTMEYSGACKNCVAKDMWEMKKNE